MTVDFRLSTVDCRLTTIKCLILLALVVPPAVAPAQGTKPAAKQPAGNRPPLFPKHRRGVYTNADNVEVIDATPQSPPLETDDPGVPDEGEYEINILTMADLKAGERQVDVFRLDANYGLVLKGWGHELPTQLKVEVPIVAAQENGTPYRMGVGNSAVGLKFNFYNDESRGLRVSVYPQAEFSTSAGVEKGVAEDGQTLEVPLLVSHQSKYFTLTGNAGLTKPLHASDRASEIELGVGLGSAFFRKLAVMGDLHTASARSFKADRIVGADAGLIYGVRRMIWYGRLGHTLFSDDGRHAYFGFGMKVLVDTRK